MATESESGLVQQKAVQKRLGELLKQQRELLQSYLVALVNQQNSIMSAKTDDLLAYVELEEQIVSDIFSIQKVIDPLEDMYKKLASPPDDIPSLKLVSEELKRQIIAQSSRNRELLSARMAEIRNEIEILRKNHITAGIRQSVYQNLNTASIVDIKG